MKKSCCTCCGPFKPRYQRLVDNIFPLNPNDGLVRNNMEKLTFFALSSPEKLDRIGEYLAKKLTRDVSRKRYGNIFIAMEALDQLLVACHAQTLNLFVESFLKMVQKLLECEEPDLNILATNSFVKFANIEEDAPSYHRRYDFFISKFASMCHNNSLDLRARLKIRKSGLRGIHAVVRKTVSDDLQVNIYELEHMKKIVPSLLFNMHDPSALETINKDQDGETNGASKSNDIAKEHRDKLNELAESCLRELVSKASYGTLKSLLKPLLTHFDSHHLWDEPNTFAVQVLRIIMYSVKPQHTHLVIDMMLAHLDKHANDGKIRTNIMRAISQIITLATVSSIGPSIHQWFNKMLQDLKRSVDVCSSDPKVMQDEEEFQETLIHTMGEFATNLPDYQKIEVLMFIMSQVPVPAQSSSENNDGGVASNFLGSGQGVVENVKGGDKGKKSNIFFPDDSPQPQTAAAKPPVGLKVRQDGKGRFITEPVAEAPQLIVSSPTEEQNSTPTRRVDVKEISGTENDPKSPLFIAQNLPGDTYPLVGPSPGPSPPKLGSAQTVMLPQVILPETAKTTSTPSDQKIQMQKAGGNTRLQMMVLHSLLKVATKYKSIQYSTTFPSTFLLPLLRMSIVQDARIRLLVQQILHTLLDRHENLEIFAKMQPVDYDVNNAAWSQLRVEKPSHLDNLFARKSGALFYSALYDSALRLNNGPENIASLIVTISLLAVEIGNEDVIFDLIRLMFALQKKCREYPFLRGPSGNKKSSSAGLHKNSIQTAAPMRGSESSNAVLDVVKRVDVDRQTTYSDSAIKDEVDHDSSHSRNKGDQVFCLPALLLELRVHAAVGCSLSFLLLQIARVFDPDNSVAPEDNASFAFAVKDSPLAKMATKLAEIYAARGCGNVSRLTLPQVALAFGQPKSEPESPISPTSFGGYVCQDDQKLEPIPGMPYPVVLERSCKELLDDDSLFYRVDSFKELFRELGVDCGRLDESLTLKSLISIGVTNDPLATSPQPDNRSLSIASSSRSNSFFFDSSSKSSTDSKSPTHSLSHKINESSPDGWLKTRRRKAKISYNDINVSSMKRVLSREKTQAEKDARESKLKQLCDWYQTAPFEEIITNTKCNEVEYRKQMRSIVFQNITRSTRSFYDEPKYPIYLGSQKMEAGVPKFNQPTSLLDMKFPRLIVY